MILLGVLRMPSKTITIGGVDIDISTINTPTKDAPKYLTSPFELAEKYKFLNFDVDNKVYYRGQYYKYNSFSSCYQIIDKKDIESDVIRFLQKNYNSYKIEQDKSEKIIKEPKCDTRTLKDVILNLNALTEVNSNYEAPFNILTKAPYTGLIFKNEKGLKHNRVKAKIRGGKTYTEALKATGMVEDVGAEIFRTHALPFNFVEPTDIKSNIWDDYKKLSLDNDVDRNYLDLVLGHILLGDKTFKICHLFRGIAGGGKSSAVKVIKALIGSDFTCSVDLVNFSNDKFNYPLFINRLNAIEEHPNARIGSQSTSVFKKSTHFETHQYKKLYENASEDSLSVINVIASNHPIMFAEQSKAISDRMRILKFNTPIRGTGKEIPDIENKILEDAPNLIHVILESYLKFKSDRPTKFPESNYHQDELNEQKENACHVARFCNEKYTKGKIGVNYCKPSDAYADYQNWCDDEGISKPFPKRELSRRFEEIMCVENGSKKINSATVRGWHGIMKKSYTPNVDDFNDDDDF